MRNKKHYQDMFDRNPDATVGFSLAASAVYAARYGVCEDEHRGTEEHAAIARALRTKYGDEITIAEVTRAMTATAAIRD